MDGFRRIQDFLGYKKRGAKAPLIGQMRKIILFLLRQERRQ